MPRTADTHEQAFRDSEWDSQPKWARGELVPHRITLLLDARGLYGPDVDLACGAVEPAIDEWEAGTRYPTWPQLVALARLVDALPGFFFRDVSPITGPIFICSRTRSKSSIYFPPTPITRYPPDVWQPVVAGIRTDTLFDLAPAGALL